MSSTKCEHCGVDLADHRIAVHGYDMIVELVNEILKDPLGRALYTEAWDRQRARIKEGAENAVTSRKGKDDA